VRMHTSLWVIVDSGNEILPEEHLLSVILKISLLAYSIVVSTNPVLVEKSN
jgi:hypothetical protein